MHPAASNAPVVLVGMALVIGWKRTDVVYVKTLEWIVKGCVLMRIFSRLMN